MVVKKRASSKGVLGKRGARMLAAVSCLLLLPLVMYFGMHSGRGQKRSSTAQDSDDSAARGGERVVAGDAGITAGVTMGVEDLKLKPVNGKESAVAKKSGAVTGEKHGLDLEQVRGSLKSLRIRPLLPRFRATRLVLPRACVMLLRCIGLCSDAQDSDDACMASRTPSPEAWCFHRSERGGCS